MNYIAQNFDSIQSNGLPGFKGGDTLGTLINNSKILDYVFGAAAIALLVYLIMGGFGFMTSQGDPKAMQSAQGKITSALTGFIIVIMAYFITKLLGQLLGIGAFETIFR